MNLLMRRIGIPTPIIQSPMAGGITTPELVAGVSNSGALGSLGAAYMKPEEMSKAIKRIKSLTKKPFAINLFVPIQDPVISAEDLNRALVSTEKIRANLKLPLPEVKPPFQEPFDEQFEIVLNEKPAVFSFHFGLIESWQIEECRRRKIITLGSATTVDEARELEELGVDAVIAQGIEAGGHQGTFSPLLSKDPKTMRALVSELVESLQVPIIAAGGIMSGGQIREVLNLGAQVAQLGTAFLACEEAGTALPYRKALLSAAPDATCLTHAFTGRWARALQNSFTLEMENQDSAVLPFPAQNAFTRDIRKKAADLDKSEYMSLWAGMGVSSIRAMKVGDLVKTLMKEFLEEPTDSRS